MIAYLLPLVLPREAFAPVWSKVESAIRSGYYARETRHDEMERRLAACAPVAKAARTRAEFDAALDAMIAGFGDSHFDFLTDDEPNYYVMDGLIAGDKAAEMPTVGAWFVRSPDGYTVQMALEGGAAEAAGLRPGDVVLRIDGLPFSPIAALRPLVGKTATLDVRRGGKPPQSVRIAVAQERALQTFLSATRQSERVVERDGRRYGVIHLWTQANDAFRRTLAEALRGPLKDTDGLVLDLRGGFGGSPLGYRELFEGPNAVYTKPLAVVIDHGTRSAKEILSYGLGHDGRAVLVGETTAGAVLGTMPRRVADWAYLEIPLSEYRVGDVSLERKGVAPDVPVPPGEDPVARAVTVLAATKV